MRTILLIIIGANLLWGSDVLTDSKTGLVWQDNSNAKSIKKDWEGAKAYCEALNLEGYDDWRLPTIKELQSIVNIKRYQPAIKKGFKNITSDDYYCSSSQYVDNKHFAWAVGFNNGVTNNRHKNMKPCYIRCVRGRQ